MKHCIRIILFLSVLTVFQSGFAAGQSRDSNVLMPVCRGVMESFTDVSDGIGPRLDFYKSLGYTHYFYSPSDDRYCNAWGWKFLYNDSDRHLVRSLHKECEARGLEFVWTVNPGEGYQWNQRDYDFLSSKIIMMYHNNLRSFAVGFSGTEGDYDAIRDSLKAEFMGKKKEPAEVFVINSLPVISFPAEDDAARTLMKGYHFDTSLRESVTKSNALLCILYERSELSRLAVVAAAELADNPEEYSSDSAFEKGIEILSPEVKGPLMTFLRHTGGVEESLGVEIFTLSEYTSEKADSLYAEFCRIEAVPGQMEACSSPELYESLLPWLTQFGRLGARGRRTIDCLNNYIRGDLGAFWISYINNRMTAEDVASYQKYNVGESLLYPFCVNMMQDLTDAFTSMLSGGVKLKNLASTLYVAPNQALDSDFTTFMPSSSHIEFPIPAQANTCRLLTGPLSEDKELLFRQLGTDGELVAEFVVTSPYTEFDLKEGAVMVDVLGDVDIYESIFVYL